jgi:hypothetical protein
MLFQVLRYFTSLQQFLPLTSSIQQPKQRLHHLRFQQP